MMFNVPQFIDVEDKIAGPLTAKQLMWMLGMGAAILAIFFAFDGAIMVIIAVPVALLFLALAFYRPNGQPLIKYFGAAFLFLFRPKLMMWDRPVGGILKKPVEKKQEEAPLAPHKAPSMEEIHRVAGMVDGKR